MQHDDWADRHVTRWRDHWAGVQFDDEIVAITVRLSKIVRYFKISTQAAVAELGLQDLEYDTLHHLMISDTPGQASPSALADELGISGAGMTGRLDALENAGWVQRMACAGDRRRVAVAVTQAGVEIWRQATDLRGKAEADLFHSLSVKDRTALARTLKRLTLQIEHNESLAEP